jgi:hypothetical protein
MTDGEGPPLVARVVDWQETMDDAAIAARLDALEARNLDRRREVLETLDVLAEQLVGRPQPVDARLKARIRAMRQAVTNGVSVDSGDRERSLASGPGPAESAPLDQGHR